jgi:hypothetical protein
MVAAEMRQAVKQEAGFRWEFSCVTVDCC